MPKTKEIGGFLTHKQFIKSLKEKTKLTVVKSNPRNQGDPGHLFILSNKKKEKIAIIGTGIQKYRDGGIYFYSRKGVEVMNNSKSFSGRALDYAIQSTKTNIVKVRNHLRELSIAADEGKSTRKVLVGQEGIKRTGKTKRTKAASSKAA